MPPPTVSVLLPVRDAARLLSGLRDKGGMIETFDKLMDATDTPPADFAALRAWLVGGQRAVEGTAQMETALDGFGAAMREMRGRIGDWSVAGDEFGALEGGLAKTWDRARRAMKAFARDPRDENVHEWRKRVKYHWYHCRLLAPIHPQEMKTRAARAKDLSEMLGDHHDITVLETHLEQAAGLPAAARRDDFLALARQRQDQLRLQALDLGVHLFGHPPKPTLKAWDKRWRKWRAA